MKSAERQLTNEDHQLRRKDILLLCLAGFALVLLMAVDGRAADPSAGYPDRPIEFVTYVTPGQTFDVLCRTMSDIMKREKILNQPLIVLNKTGGAGAVAAGYVFERKGNPFIIMAISDGPFLQLPLLQKVPYDYKSFTLIANLVVNVGNLLVVRKNSPFKTAGDILTEARKRPKELLQGGASPASAGGIQGRNWQKEKGVQWKFVSFVGGDAESLVNVLNGNVDFAFANPPNAFEHVRAGTLRVLATSRPSFYPELKGLPTYKEVGIEPIDSYYGIMGPPNMPSYAVTKLEAALKKLVDTDRFKQYMKDSWMEPAWLSPDEYIKFLEKSTNRWKVWLGELDLLPKSK